MDFLRLARKNLLLIALLASLFVLVSALSIFFIRSETERNRLLMESTASRTASLLLEAFFQEGTTQDPALAESIVGFGLYAGAATPVVRYGSAPEDLRSVPGLAEGKEYVRNRERGTLVHVRAVATTTGLSMLRLPRIFGRVGFRYLYLEIDVRAYLRRQAFYNAALAAVPLVIAIVTALAGSFALKNAQYREQIAAQERLARLGEAARALAHELKNPLNVIKLRARLLRKGAAPEAAADLDVVEEEVERLSGLTGRDREVLQDARGAPEAIELEGYARDLVTRSAWQATIAAEGGAPYVVRFDPSRLRSVLENLIRNARESMPGLSPLPPVELVLRRDRDQVILSVLDRGVGIRAEDADRVFDPFFTTKTSGSGIGLSISRRFIEAAGGRIQLLGREGGGTEARVTLRANGDRR